LGFAAECLKPKFAVLDPSVTFSLPPRQTANGVVDAFVHVAEQYMTYPVRAQIPDRFSEAVFKTLMEEGPIALEKPDDYDARANIMWAATNGLNRILATGVPQDWVSHAIGHELTAMFGIDHGRTLAVVLPAVYEYEKESKKQKLAQFARRVLGKTGSDDELADVTINETRAFFEKMGTKTHLSDYGIGEDAIPKLVKKLEEHGQTGCGEHHDIGPKEMGEILRLAL
ncbi:MAG TPA: NADH-dependent alcohol dehydrogenase, partial [Ruminococcaceae bacterium]|nr:NADH-dependent alcohol dehydrogenase [Oscillospiraceae bacterium]